MSDTLAFMAPGAIGPLSLKNRVIRAATSETMAFPDGAATAELTRLYTDLAKGGAGLSITGHIYVEPCGQYEPRQAGLDCDARVAPWREVTSAVHREGGRIFAELSHAGSQTILPQVRAIAPSPIPNTMSARPPLVMTEDDIHRVIEAFAAAARRAEAAGFDGVHIHSGNGYLLSQFNSPLTNGRTDAWGGDAERRGRFLAAVVAAVRSAISPNLPVTARIGLADAVPEGLTLPEGLRLAERLADAGLAAIEVSYGLMSSYLQNIRPYVGVSPWRGLRDGSVGPLLSAPAPEAYYRSFARAAKERTGLPIILVGGLRSTQVMDAVVRSGDADFVALARPFVREPDLVRAISSGRRGPVACISCNLCLVHEGVDPLRCWRTPLGLLKHAYKHYVRRARIESALAKASSA